MRATLFDLSARDRLRIEGADAAAFLNRLLTLDVLHLEVGCGARTFLLSSTGRVEACFHLLRTGEERFLAECGAGHGAEVCAQLDRYHFGERITFVPCDDLTVFTLQGDGAAELLPEAPSGPWDHVQTELGRVARVDRGGDGYDVWCAAAPTLDAERGDLALLERMRVAAGVPDFPAEYGPHSSPLEVSGTSGVTEQKGCYPGQEVIERTLAIGRPPRKLVRLTVADGVTPGAEVLAGGAKAGVVTSVVGALALALVKRKLEDDSELTCEGHGARFRT